MASATEVSEMQIEEGLAVAASETEVDEVEQSVQNCQLVARLGADQGPAGPDQLHHHGEGELPEVKSGQLVAQLRADPRSTAGPAKQGVIVVHAQHLIEGGQVGVGGQPTGLDGQEGHHK